jgi:hypothetical protein
LANQGFKVATKNMYEIFDEVEKSSSSKDDVVNILRENTSYCLRSVLQGMFHPNIEFVIDRVPPYKPSDSPIGLGLTSIYYEIDRTYIFEKNNARVDANLSYDRKEQILIQILESLEKQEAEIYLMMLQKKPNVKGLTYDVVKEAFPNLLP